MNVSVVIPTRNRPEKLGKCLAALKGQGAELVVVDDGSRKRELVARVVAQAGARLVRLEGKGPAAARNAGARAAAGGVICFTDDDCEPRPGWMEALAGPVLAGEARATAGRTEVAANSSAADRAWQAIANHLQRWGAAPNSPSPGFAASCNLCCSRELLLKLPFDESFSMAAGEDRDWSARAAACGAAPVFVPGARVIHRPNLSTVAYLRQQYRYGRGATSFRAADQDRRLGPPSFYTGLLRSSFSAGLAPGALVLAAQLATAAGALRERLTARAKARH